MHQHEQAATSCLILLKKKKSQSKILAWSMISVSVSGWHILLCLFLWLKARCTKFFFYVIVEEDTFVSIWTRIRVTRHFMVGQEKSKAIPLTTGLLSYFCVSCCYWKNNWLVCTVFLHINSWKSIDIFVFFLSEGLQMYSFTSIYRNSRVLNI